MASILGRRVLRPLLSDPWWLGLRDGYYRCFPRHQPWLPAQESRWLWSVLPAGPFRVLSGPFADMRYVGDAIGSAFLPKLLGTYEMELHPVLREFASQPMEFIVNLGAAEGYYAVGSAMLWPQARVVAFEAEEEGRRLCRTMARRNGVTDRVKVRGTADVDVLRELVSGARRVLVIVDVEGAETSLLDPQAVPWLRRAAMLVEMHDNPEDHHSEILRGRFEATHAVKFISTRARFLDDFPPGRDRAAENPVAAIAAMDEHRPGPMRWLILKPHPHGPAIPACA